MTGVARMAFKYFFDDFFLRKVIERFGRKDIVWKLREKLRLQPVRFLEAAVRKYSGTEIRKAYRENLKFVLQYVKDLIKYLPGKTIITSDYGELLGEAGEYGHSFHKPLPALVEVPWLKVNSKR